MADDPDMPIRFESKTGRYVFTYQEPDADGPSTLMIYHCPWCGGLAPRSKRPLQFHVIPRNERERLDALLATVRTIRGALKQLGKPDDDNPTGTSVQHLETANRGPSVRHFRTLTYTRLSNVADLRIIEKADGRVSYSLVGKHKEKQLSKKSRRTSG